MKKLSASVNSFAHCQSFMLAAVEIPHGVAADRRHGREHVVAAAIDLLDVVVVGVDGAEQDLVGRQADRRRVNPERRVGKFRKPRVGLSLTVPNAQIGKYATIVITLGCLLTGGVGDAVGARKQAVEMIEAAVLRIEDDDGLNARQIGRRGRALGGEQREANSDGRGPLARQRKCWQVVSPLIGWPVRPAKYRPWCKGSAALSRRFEKYEVRCVRNANQQGAPHGPIWSYHRSPGIPSRLLYFLPIYHMSRREQASRVWPREDGTWA